MARLSASEAFYTAFQSWSTISCRSKRRIPATIGCSPTFNATTPRRFASWRASRITNLPMLQRTRDIEEALPKEIIDAYPKLALDKFLQKLADYSKNPSTSNRAASTLKRYMRSMPHSTVLITALHGQAPSISESLSPLYPAFRGAVVSSMTSVTLGPPPVVSFNLRQPSATLEAIKSNGWFAVHFLEDSVDGADLASTFLRHPGDHEAAWKDLSKNRHISLIQRQWFDKTSTKPHRRSIVPTIQGPGVLANLVCRFTPQSLTVQDHIIVVAEVKSEVIAPPWRFATESDSITVPPFLMYSGGQFRHHGEAISIPENHTPSTDGQTLDQIPLYHTMVTGQPPLYQAAWDYIYSCTGRAKTVDSPHLPKILEELEEATTLQSKRDRFIAALHHWRRDPTLHEIDGSEVTSDDMLKIADELVTAGDRIKGEDDNSSSAQLKMPDEKFSDGVRRKAPGPASFRQLIINDPEATTELPKSDLSRNKRIFQKQIVPDLPPEIHMPKQKHYERKLSIRKYDTLPIRKYEEAPFRRGEGIPVELESESEFKSSSGGLEDYEDIEAAAAQAEREFGKERESEKMSEALEK